MIVNRCSENLLTKSKKLYENYRDNCTVVQRMLEKYKKIYPNISDYSIMHFIDIAEFCDLIMDRQKLHRPLPQQSPAWYLFSVSTLPSAPAPWFPHILPGVPLPAGGGY